MKHSYFILLSDRLDYPLYVAFDGSMSIDDVRNHDVLREVVCNLTRLDYTYFVVDKCTERAFFNGLIKIDFGFN